MLPEASYHQTIANTLSDKRFFENIVNNNILDSFPGIMGKAFDSIQIKRYMPIKMRMIGLNVFGSCLALLGVFGEEEDFNAILSFREKFYGNSELDNLNIKWTRPFVGHITIAYLGRDINEEERFLLANAINNINKNFDFSRAYFNILQCELRSYTDLSHFIRKPDYPIYSFLK